MCRAGSSKPLPVLTVRDNVAEVPGADAGSDGGPRVGLGPRQLAGGQRVEGVAGLAQLDGGRETFPAISRQCAGGGFRGSDDMKYFQC